MKLFPQQRHVSPFPFSTLAWALDKTVNDTRPIGVSTTSLCLLASSPFAAPPPAPALPPVRFQFLGGSFPAPSPPGLQAFLEKFPEPGRLSPSVHLPNSDSTFPASPQFHSSSSLWPSPHCPSFLAHLQMGSPGFLTHLLPWRVTLGPACASPPETTAPPAPTIHMLQP